MTSFTEIRDLVEDVQRANPRDRTEQQLLLNRILAYRDLLTRASSQELATYLETAAMLTDHLAQMGGLGPEDIQAMVVRLVSTVDNAFSRVEPPGAGQAPQVPPLPHGSRPSPEVPMSLSLNEHSAGGPQVSSDKLLGEILLQLRFVTEGQVDEGLRVQKAAGIRLGEALVQTGALNFGQVKQAISIQQKLRQTSA